MENAIVLYPSPGIGHLISMVELGKLILTHHPRFSITVLLITTPPKRTNITPNSTTQQQATNSVAQYIAAVSATTPSINFHHLPQVSLPPDFNRSTPDTGFELPRYNNPNLHHALLTISKTSKLKAFLIDFFCDAAFEVAAEQLKIPTYYFFTSSASGLAVFLKIPTIDSNISIDIPNLPSIPFSSWPDPLVDRTTTVYKNFSKTATRMPNSHGIIVNTFEFLEKNALKAISDGVCVPEGTRTPPVFCIGPLISTTGNESGEEQNKCLNWLDKQPKQSVVFLCFGSMGLFPSKQLKEIAIALENSEQRFLWVVKNPPPDNQNSEKIDGIDDILPKGFLERTKDRGLVVRQWAPQVAVLSHNSVGGFVTHCGWNSVLESVSAGVPMLAWPLYAEQKMNRLFMVEDVKVALAVNESEDGFVSAAELERRVRELMDSEKGREVRDRVLGLRDSATAAMKDDGSSRAALNNLTEQWCQN
ncbi:anthocyanidin 5,3-O-glucosyltransferase-like [Ziziphus jujuba]|uniref:Glycosyltransferase n=1 Tax=Ziziphus jujuba TaxID=326968 RepID=A0A6P3ZIS8_ZIZJJ|nr:anthocyanidin 5,3-O-glucosyltransferase-like [Ziziphus jujuba]